MPPQQPIRGPRSLTPETLARLHGSGFDRPWSAQDFAQLLDQPGCVLVGDEAGFALARLVLDEAEVLTVVTAPDQRGQGVATRVLRALLARLAERGAARVFLEVAEDNDAALALYSAAGFTATGRRRGYYPRPGQQAIDAILLSRDV